MAMQQKNKKIHIVRIVNRQHCFLMQALKNEPSSGFLTMQRTDRKLLTKGIVTTKN